MERKYILVHAILQLSNFCITLYRNVLFYTTNSKLQFLECLYRHRQMLGGPTPAPLQWVPGYSQE